MAVCPWHGLDPKLFSVAFLSGEPDSGLLAAIDHEALLPERVVVGERVLYLDQAQGVRRSRLARLDVGVDATAHNWRTVTALHELTRSAWCRWAWSASQRRPAGRPVRRLLP